MRECAQHHLELFEAGIHPGLGTELLELNSHTAAPWKEYQLASMRETIEHAEFHEWEVLSTLDGQMEYFSLRGFPMDQVRGVRATGA